MNYHFSFNKNTAILVLAAGSVVGALLFFAGYRIGLDRGFRRAQVELVQQAAAVQAPKGVVNAQIPDGQAAAGQGASAEAGTPGATEAESGGSQSASSEPPQPGGPITTREGFTVQIGAYQTEDPAQELKDKFATRGYSAFIFQGKDSAGQSWYVVRIGHFKDLEPATREAVNFTMREKMPAYVRPLNEL